VRILERFSSDAGIQTLDGGAGTTMNEDDLVPVFIPSLGVLLLNLEKKKGAPLNRDEVLEIRDNAVVMMLPRNMARELAEKRGYEDVDPGNCWAAFQELKRRMEETASE